MVADTQRVGSWVHRRRLGALAAGASLVLAFVPSALAGGAVVTRGDIHAFATGTGLPISGRAQMVRTADGKTTVSVHIEGLAAITTYGSHVHQLPCGTSEADGHYKNDPAGPATPPNEIWPGFTTNGAGVGNGNATVDWTAGQAAVSVVVHAPGGAKIACADLE
jgi:Cu-Zn family superoxide dismutase